jgi:hypothetical protein
MQIKYSKISTKMSSLYFGLDKFCQFEAEVPKFDAVFSIQCTLYKGEGRGCASNSGILASNRQNIYKPKYKDDISLLISQYLISRLQGQKIKITHSL